METQQRINMLIVGFKQVYVRELSKVLPEASLTIIEEPEFYERQGLEVVARRFPCIREVLLTSYRQRDDYLDKALAAHAETPFQAVLPGMEYGVPAAARLAECFGLPGATSNAAKILRDKLLMRRCTSLVMPTPRFAEVKSVEDVRQFFKDSPDGIVLKPANRMASLGISVIDSERDIESAWCDLVGLPEQWGSMAPSASDRYLVEERLKGLEISTVALVENGVLISSEVIEQITSPGAHPVKLGHLLPAPLSGELVEKIRISMQQLVSATGFDTGCLYAEWIIREGCPMLIECGGRPPGDRICDLFRISHGRSFCILTAQLLSGAPIEAGDDACCTAGIRFFTAKPGKVKAIDGESRVAAMPGVVDIVMTAKVGDVVRELRSSWDRVGHVIVTGKTNQEVSERSELALSTIRVLTEGNRQ